MKLRHAAALVLVGWYLMSPRLSGRPGEYAVVRGESLVHWHIDASFDSAAECEQARIEAIRGARQLADKAGHPNPSEDVLVEDRGVRCVHR